MVHLQLSDIQNRWTATTPAQDLVDDMITKMNHMVLTTYSCLNTYGKNKAKVHELVGISERICKDFKAMAGKPESWVNDTVEKNSYQPDPEEEFSLSLAPTIQTNPNPWDTIKPVGASFSF